MKKLWLILCAAIFAGAFPAAAAPPIKAMILDGEQGGPYHAWQETTPYLKLMLEDSGLFQVDVYTMPANGDFSKRPEWSKYQVVIGNYDAPDGRWPQELMASFEEYVRNGGGFVSVHAADNAFPKWLEYNLMIGIGGWRGRNQAAGPMWYFKDGKLVQDDSPGSAGAHGSRQAFKMENRVTDHPITKGLPKEWMHVPDELYGKMRGPGKDMTILSTAYSTPTNRGTDRDEPILMVLNYGKGRIFHTTLGHDLAALDCVGFIATYQRGAEWAATGKVTQKVPTDFPTADKAATRPAYDPPKDWVSPPAPRRPAATPGAPGAAPAPPAAPPARPR